MSRRPGDRASLMTSEEIERARLEIDRERLELEKTKADLARSFLARHSAILIPAPVSLAAVIVSLGQVWVTQIQKNKELEVIVVQKRLELEMQDAQRKRELDISAARFVTDNRQAIFLGTPEEQELLARLISTLFPIEVSTPLLRRLERASPAAGKQAWQKGIEASAGAAAAVSRDGKRFLKIEQDRVQVWDAETGRLLTTLTSSEPLKAAYFSSDGKRITTEAIGGGSHVWDLATGRVIESSPK